MVTVMVRRMEGRRLLGTARQHHVVTDRTVEDGGTDTGCTSGELLLLSIGSCATGSIRNFLQSRGVACPDLSVEVSFAEPAKPGAREAIALDVALPVGIDESLLPQTLEAAQSGGVVSRLRLGSDIIVRMRAPQSS